MATDIEWGKDGVDGKIYMLQARPETVKSSGSVRKRQRYKIKVDVMTGRFFQLEEQSVKKLAVVL